MSADVESPQAVGAALRTDATNNECLEHSTVAQKIGDVEPVARPFLAQLLGEEVVLSWSLGKATNYAKVTAEGQTTLANFISNMLKTPREGLLNANEYANASSAAQKQDKSKFSWYSLGHYKTKYRNSANWLGGNIAVLDLDASYGLKKNKIEYSFSADSLHERLYGLNFIALPTHSYTDDVPRWRVLIPLSETLTDRKEYECVISCLAEKFDNFIDPRSLLPEQLWFVMSAPKGEWNNRVSRIVVGG